MKERHLSLSEAAGVLSKSERTLRRWIKSGKLRAAADEHHVGARVRALEER